MEDTQTTQIILHLYLFILYNIFYRFYVCHISIYIYIFIDLCRYLHMAVLPLKMIFQNKPR